MAGAVRILLVEDEPGDALLVEEALTDPSFGRWAEIVHLGSLSGLEATGPVDCALLDLGLPGFSGLEALHRFRAVRPDIPVVVLTGLDAEDTALEALAAGALDYVTKDEVTPRGLRRAIRYTLERHRMNLRLQQFNGFVAHDLKNPLAVILHSADLLARRPLAPADEKQLLGGITQATLQAIQLIDDLLAYAHATTAILEPVNLDKLVAEVVGEMGVQLELAEGDVQVPDPLPVVAGQPAALRQVLRNLFANALAYRSTDRPPRVTVTAAPAGDDVWRISVADNGSGIPEHQREAVFEPGVRLARHVPGSGLGLAAVRTLVERHGGQVVIATRPPELGTTFLIDLPRFRPSGAGSR